MEAVQVSKLVKTFGKLKAIDDLSIEIEAGELFGLLGPNGAGKSTLIRILIGLSKPTCGTVRVGGVDVTSNPRKVRDSVGLVSEKVILYDKLSPLENLLFFASMKNIPKKEAMVRIHKLLDRVDMTAWKDKPVRVFSKGMRQRINFVRALVHNPKIVFMDEPTVGLDPHTTRTIRQIIEELNDEGTTIVLTTHLMQEAEIVSTRIAIMNHGKIIANGSVYELKRLLNRDSIRLTVSGKTDVSLDDIEGVVARKKSKNNLIIDLKSDVEIEEVIRKLTARGLIPLNIERIEPLLEDIFIELTKNTNHSPDK